LAIGKWILVAILEFSWANEYRAFSLEGGEGAFLHQLHGAVGAQKRA
jgi:hypothetical protein